MSQIDLSNYKAYDTWTTSEGLLEGKPIIIRIRQSLRPLAGHAQFPNRMRIVWQYEPKGESGLPSAELLRRMATCEDALVDALECDNLAILTHVMTCDGVRQWVFYASDTGQCTDRLQETLSEDVAAAIGVNAMRDEPWSEFTAVLEAIGQ